MDLKAVVADLEAKIKGNPDVLANFKADPIKTVEGILGIDLPDEQLKSIADGLKAKLAASQVKDTVSGLGDKLKGLFG